jgi:hypothetical protein
LDLFLTGQREGFAPPPPFIRGALPEKPYPKEQVRAYLTDCRARCQATLSALTPEKAAQRCIFSWMELSFWELQLYSMRHVQEHAAELNLMLGQHGVTGQDWVPSARA